MARKPSTNCRYCHEGGELYKGAHRACKADATRQSIRNARGVDPARYTHASDKKPNCSICAKPKDGGSELCAECRKKRKKNRAKQFMARYRANLRKREVRAEKFVPRPCACGCGVLVVNPKARYATSGCWNRVRPRKAAKRPAQSKPLRVIVRMPEKFIGSTPAPQPGPTINNGVAIRVIPSLMKATLRDPETWTFWREDV